MSKIHSIACSVEETVEVDCKYVLEFITQDRSPDRYHLLIASARRVWAYAFTITVHQTMRQHKALASLIREDTFAEQLKN